MPKVPKIKSNGSDQNPVDRDPRLVFSGSVIRISFFHFPNPEPFYPFLYTCFAFSTAEPLNLSTHHFRLCTSIDKIENRLVMDSAVVR